MPDLPFRTSVRTAVRRTEELLSAPAVLPAVIAATVVLAYGNEIFNIHLTIDEEYFADSPMWRAWLGDGRWGMALLSGVLMPRTVSPVVSSVIGVLGVAAALNLFLSTWMTSRIARFVAVTFGAVFPSLPYLFTFSTLSYGAGVGAMACAIAFTIVVRGRSPARWLAVIVLYAFAIAIYQPFLFVFAVMVFIYVAAGLIDRKPVRPALMLLAQTAASALGALALYVALLWLARLATGIELSSYVSGQVDVTGFVASPRTRLLDSVKILFEQLSASPEMFRGSAGYVGFVLVVSVVAAVVACALRAGAGHAALMVGLIAIVGLFLVLIEATSPGESDLRTLVHLPFLAAGLVALALQALLALDRSRVTVVILAMVVGAATLGLVTDMNRLFMSTEILFERDVYLASRVDEKLVQLGAPDQQQPLSFVLIGNRRQVEGPATPTRETIGTSFFEWDGGNPGRSAVFIHLLTGRKLAPVPPDVAARIAAVSRSMPSWPQEGSLRLDDDIAILKLSEPTPEQNRLWCEHGVEDFCLAP